MGILDRIRTVLKSNINALISKAEDPEKMLNQLLMDMNEQLLEAKKQVAMTIADEKKLERQALENKALGADWEKKAMLAVKAGKDDLAKEALVRKQEYDGYAASFQKEYEGQHASVEQLKDALRQLQDRNFLGTADVVHLAHRSRRLTIRTASQIEKAVSATAEAWSRTIQTLGPKILPTT